MVPDFRPSGLTARRGFASGCLVAAASARRAPAERTRTGTGTDAGSRGATESATPRNGLPVSAGGRRGLRVGRRLVGQAGLLQVLQQYRHRLHSLRK